MERVRSSKPMASAQLMSCPSDFQPGSKHQAHHLFPIVIPMPKPELASEKVLRSVRGTGPGTFLERVGDWRRSAHHLRSLEVSQGGVCGMKGLLLKPESMASRLVRYTHPAVMTREACSSLPYNFCTSTRGCIGFFSHSLIMLRYLSFFSAGMATECVSRSQMKLRYGITDPKGIVLEFSHGMPNSSERRSISLSVYANIVSCSVAAFLSRLIFVLLIESAIIIHTLRS